MLSSLPGQPNAEAARSRALWLSTAAFTICFAVWTVFSIIGIRIKDQLGLSETEFGLLIGTPILTGSLVRIVLGVWTSRYGGRLVYTATMLSAALATFLLAYADTFQEVLIAALGVGLAGGSFAVGVTYVSRFFPAEKQGTALGIFGAGNVGAAVTKFLAPFVLLAAGWQAVAQLWAIVLVITAVAFWFAAPADPVSGDAKRKQKSFFQEFAALKHLQVWRFALYYFFAFGAFVALALWLPRYLIGVYGFDLATAGVVAAAFSIPGSIFRAYGGVLSDRVGARTVMYWTFWVSAAVTLILSMPPATILLKGASGPVAMHVAVGPMSFIALVFVLGFFMSLGKAAVYKHIPVYYPNDVGAVGGLVGMIGGLGGFILPIAFGALRDLTGLWTSCFMLLFLIVIGLLIWMSLAIRRLEHLPADIPVSRAIGLDEAATAGATP
jgi:NNP family nitrate/nitrite transporter-like MFS transporter